MLKQLKHKMLLTIMIFVSIIVVAFVVAINVIPSHSFYTETMSFLEQQLNPDLKMGPKPDLITGNNNLSNTYNSQTGSLPPQNAPANAANNKNMMAHSNMITIELNEDYSVKSWSSNRSDLYDDETIDSLALQICSGNKSRGVISGYYYISDTLTNHPVIIISDNRITCHNFRTVLIITLLAGCLVWILLWILSIYIVNRMTRPISETFEKQKQFISDAGHELKTPVAVISANSDVLSNEIGDNKWLSYIKTETKRMDQLIKTLMELAQLDDADKQFTKTRIDLSQTVLGAALPLESMAFENGTIMEFEVAPNIYINANQEQIERLVIILLTNAMKYGKERGLIKISLEQHHKSARLTVYNTGIGIRPEDKEKIFERFYRVEKERSRKDGNYGLGLAIAKAIVEDHHGKISVESEYGKDVTFGVELPE